MIATQSTAPDAAFARHEKATMQTQPTTTSTTLTTDPRLIVAFKNQDVSTHVCHAIVDIAVAAIAARGTFTIALSGGTLPTFLTSLKDTFEEKGVDPKLDCWHVLLTDERCVPGTDSTWSNLKTLKDNLFSVLQVPTSQIHGICEPLLSESAEHVAEEYETTVRSVISKSGGELDLAVLGFGTDGRICNLFPGHTLLKEDTKLVASVDYSSGPNSPASGITMTLPMFNNMTRNVIFCGAGGSAYGPMLRNVFKTVHKAVDPSYSLPGGAMYKVTREDTPPNPSAMVSPTNSLTWIVDGESMKDAMARPSPY